MQTLLELEIMKSDKDFTDFAHFFAACVQNNIQLNRKTCYNYKIQFGGYYIWEVQANDL